MAPCNKLALALATNNTARAKQKENKLQGVRRKPTSKQKEKAYTEHYCSGKSALFTCVELQESMLLVTLGHRQHHLDCYTLQLQV